ncbi:MAG: ParB N-terminal domain-containing protein [Verrucomicrobiota bacterium]|jgi:hypothetical protein
MPSKPKKAIPVKRVVINTEAKHAQMIQVDDLLYDSRNPRFPKTLLGADEPGAIKWMLDNANIIELMNSIGEQGYFQGEPLVVVSSAVHPAKFEVIEGNRRLTAVKLLRNPALAPIKKKSVAEVAAGAKNKPDKLPCLEYSKPEEVLHFLAFRHVTGILAWDPLQKARYLKRLAETKELKKLDAVELRRHLAKEIGSTPNYVARLIAGLAVFEALEEAEFFGIPNLDAEGDRYSVLTTAVTSYNNIAHYLGLENVTDDQVSKIKKQNLEKLARWLFERNAEGVTRVPESRALKKLNRVIAKREALDRFESGRSLDEADLFTEGPLETFRAALEGAKSRLEVARDVVHLAVGLAEADIQAVEDVKGLATVISGAVKETRSSKNK